MRGGHTVFRIQHLARASGVDFPLGGHGLGFRDHRKEGGFHDESPRLFGSRLANDDATGWGFGFDADVVILEREAVQHHAMHGDMFNANRIVGKGFIEIVAVEQATAGHDGVVITVAHDHLALRYLALRGISLQLGDDARHVLAWARWRRVELALVGD